jgi:hypothetical protein
MYIDLGGQIFLKHAFLNREGYGRVPSFLFVWWGETESTTSAITGPIVPIPR